MTLPLLCVTSYSGEPEVHTPGGHSPQACAVCIGALHLGPTGQLGTRLLQVTKSVSEPCAYGKVKMGFTAGTQVYPEAGGWEKEISLAHPDRNAEQSKRQITANLEIHL